MCGSSVYKCPVMPAVKRIIDLPGSGGIADKDVPIAKLSAEYFILRSAGAHSHRKDDSVCRNCRRFSGLDIFYGDFLTGDRLPVRILNLNRMEAAADIPLFVPCRLRLWPWG